MKETARSANERVVILNDECNNIREKDNDDEYVKVRVQSTAEEITGFHKLLDKCEELGLCQVMNFSDIFPNKGTNKYFRAYSDVKLSKEGVDNE